MGIKIVLTHTNPDFDAFASAVAAYRYHECDAIFVCSSFDVQIRKFIEKEEPDIEILSFNEKKLKSFNDEIDLIIITDCKLKNRLGILGDLVDKSKEIIIYDHHPIDREDINPDKIYLEKTGSATTIIADKLLKDKSRNLNETDLTLFLLGIYEDTGFLSFSGTTSKDLLVASKIVEAGGKISKISEYIKRYLTRDHIYILNELLMNMYFYSAGNINIGISYASIDEYIDDVSILSHRIMEIENLDAIFIAVRTEAKIVVIGRSNVSFVNTKKILEKFGGGGHPAAASAIVKDMTLNDCFDKLKELIKENIDFDKKASEIMTTPAKHIHSNATFEEVNKLFLKYNLNMMPVTENGKTVGLISKKDILQGMKHGFAKEPISAIMQIEFDTIKPTSTLSEIEEIMLGKNQKLLPVEDNNKLLGVVTRTDLLRILEEEFSGTSKYISKRTMHLGLSKVRNIKNLMKNRLPEKYYKLLIDVGKCAEKIDMFAYVAGGFVRDLLMNVKNLDIDIVVEGNAIELAKEFAALYDAKYNFHQKFQTAVVQLKDGFKIDFATARTEYYNVPAAIPEVENSSIKNDLYRRDFTINAMCVSLTPKNFGKLLDFFGGQKDIKDKKIRVLHNLSFVDDPSRCFRAIRFAVRYNFEIGPHTHKLLKHAVNLELFDKIHGNRLFLELKYILSEKNYFKGIEKLCEYNLLKFFSNKIVINDNKKQKFDYLNKLTNWYSVQFEKNLELWKCRFGVLFKELTFRDMQALIKRLDFSSGFKDEISKGFFKTKSIAVHFKKIKNPTPYEIYVSFNSLKDEFVLLSGVLIGEEFENNIKNYFLIYRNIKTEINGNDLKKLGFKPSKKFGEVLNKILELKINGQISSKEEEIEIAKELLKDDNQ